jgi:RES domain-containing protein
VKWNRVAEAFDGEGARKFGGRWNSKGKRVVYTSGSLSLAILETLVHLDSHEVLARRYCRIALDFPEKICETLDSSKLPAGWDSDIPVNFTRNVGDKWLNEARSAVLAVPSALSPGEMNFLLNPDHKDFALVTRGAPERFIFSKRFLK